MKAQKIVQLIQLGAHDRVRAGLKRLALKDRLPVLHECIPYIQDTSANLKFFRDNFSQEIGALIQSEYDYAKAEKLYNHAKVLR